MRDCYKEMTNEMLRQIVNRTHYAGSDVMLNVFIFVAFPQTLK
jgi:hypothetical protein